MSRRQHVCASWAMAGWLLIAPCGAAAASTPPPHGAAARSSTESYWERWRIVTLALRAGDDGLANPVEVVASYDPEAAIDSLKATASSWRWTDDPADGEGLAFAHFSRTPRPAEPDRALPSGVVERIRTDPKLSVWADACRRCLPEFDPALFAGAGTGRFYEMPAPAGAEFARRAAFGLFEISPDGSLALDPFQGIEIAPDSTAGLEPDTGFVTYDLRTKARVHYHVMSYREVATAAWLDDSTFVMVGSVGVDHPASVAGRASPWISVPVACVWLCHVESEEETSFLGPPLPPTRLIPACSALAEVRPTLYPAVRWEW